MKQKIPTEEHKYVGVRTGNRKLFYVSNSWAIYKMRGYSNNRLMSNIKANCGQESWQFNSGLIQQMFSQIFKITTTFFQINQKQKFYYVLMHIMFPFYNYFSFY